jgi:hypothetical protein
MKKVLLVVATVALTAISFTSCNKTCVCKDKSTDEVVYSQDISAAQCDLQEVAWEQVSADIECTR